MSNKLCEHCKKAIPIDSKFCAFCGNRQSTQSLTGQLPAQYMLDGRYIIDKLIGQGGMGAVYHAVDTRINGRICAIKEMSVMSLPAEEQAPAIQNFQREAELLAKLRHPNLPMVHDYFSVDHNRYYLVMDYVDGSTLENLLVQNGQPFSEAQVRTWALQLCDVLAYLHSQTPPIIFRDLKPENIMLDQREKLKLIDFGIARFFQKAKTKDTQIMGTPGYVPPEQYGQGQTDPRSDVYSLGVTLWRLLTMQEPSSNPYRLAGVRNYNKNISNELENIIQNATKLAPEDRYQTAEAFQEALEKKEVSPKETKPAPQKPNYFLWASLAVVTLIALYCGGVYLLNNIFSPVVDPPPTQIVANPTITETDATEEIVDATDIAGEATDVVEAEEEIDFDRPIVFDSTRDGTQAEIYIMNPDGSDPRRLTDNDVSDEEPDLSPDGQRIAFVREESDSEKIWVMRSTGSNEQSLIRGRSPDWHPSGHYFAYESLGTSPNILIYHTSVGTSRVLTRGGDAFRAPTWSPDGAKLAAMSFDGEHWQIVTIDISDGTVAQVTSDSGDKHFPAWSPDGSLIAYHTINDDGWPDDIWLIEPSGEGARAVTNDGNNGRPTWSPDSENLLFNRYIDGQWVLYQTDLEGQQDTAITTEGSDQRASWGN